MVGELGKESGIYTLHKNTQTANSKLENFVKKYSSLPHRIPL